MKKPLPLVLPVLLLLPLSIFFAILGWRFIAGPWLFASPPADSWVMQDDRQRQKRSQPVIGDLGGVPVSIPPGVVWLVEYEGDPHFMEKRKGPRPQRTFQSRLNSFGFEVRYPDMAPQTTPKTKEEQNIYTTTWLRVGVTSGSFYGDGDDSLERHVASITTTQRYGYHYELSPEKTYGLTTYVPVGPRVGTPLNRENTFFDESDTFYFHRGEDGRATTYIRCRNVPHHAAPCEQLINLSPAMKAHVAINYRIGLLPHWREIRTSVSRFILDFAVKPVSAATSQQSLQKE